jgi:hypothetical protein
MTPKINSMYVFPDIEKGNNKSEFHLPRLLLQLKKQCNINTEYIDSRKLQLLSLETSLNGQIFFINWLDTLYLSFLNKYLAYFISFSPKNFKDLVVSFISIKIETIFLDIIAKGGKVLFYYHDIQSFSRLEIIREIDKRLRPFIYSISSVNFFAENSAISCIEDLLGSKRNNKVCFIGSYFELHGALKNNIKIREKYRIPLNATVVLSIGTIRSNRNIKEFYCLFNNQPNLFFLAAGRGNKAYKSNNVIVFDDFVSNEILIELISCSNYILHSGFNYLTSAAVRVAISYGIPVIAEPFGSTIDMCSGSLIEFREPYDKVFKNLPGKDSELYFEMQRKAKISNSERTWSKSANQFCDALNLIN